ncbi:hypothetical protein FKM82_000195 [Ascaphus truei]
MNDQPRQRGNGRTGEPVSKPPHRRPPPSLQLRLSRPPQSTRDSPPFPFPGSYLQPPPLLQNINADFQFKMGEVLQVKAPI